MAKRKQHFYARHNLKPVTAFLSPLDHTKLSKLAKNDRRSMVNYVTRLLEQHIQTLWKQRAEELYRTHKTDTSTN